MNSIFLWHFVVPASIGIIELLLCNLAWHQYYYGELEKFVSGAMKRRITMPLLIAIPLYLVVMLGWWKLQATVPPNSLSIGEPMSWFVKLLLVVVVTALTNVFVYSIADGICQKYVAPKLPREPYHWNGSSFRRGRSGW